MAYQVINGRLQKVPKSKKSNGGYYDVPRIQQTRQEEALPKTAPDKGRYGGSCNITRCQRPASAYWFNHSTRKYYCRGCAWDLNHDSFNKREALEMWGHLLCTEGLYDPEFDYRKAHEERAK